ncbi:GFA family protein [Hypericibacter sp.]|uniref:GFA family protein n=1 Tax=Hypericibacter sp. TaxID=2705401 RepID=UPI003D6CD9D9
MSASTMKILEGGCLCGAVRYRVEGAPRWSAHCHCKDCRRASGAPFVTYAGFLPARLQWTKGRPKDFNSSPGVTRSFCATCGSPLAYEGDRWPDEIHIHVGTLDHPEAIQPQVHVYTVHQIPWLQLADGLPKVPMPPSEAKKK